MSEPEREVLSELVIQAVRDWESTRRGEPSPFLMLLSRQLGYAGPTDELRSFFHSSAFVGMAAELGVNPDAALQALGLEKGNGCLCAACTGTEGYMYLAHRSGNHLFDPAVRMVHPHFWSKILSAEEVIGGDSDD